MPRGAVLADHNRRAMFAAAGAAQDNFDGQNDPTSLVRQFTARDAIEEQIGRHAAHLLRRLANNGQWRRRQIRKIEIIEARKGNIVGNTHSQIQERAQNISRRQRIRSENGR